MLVKEKLWDIREYDKQKAGCLAAELSISPLVTGILLERGLENAQAMKDFLYGSENPFHDPLLMKDMEKAVDRILLALERQEKITVYGDYDVDGITASSLLYLYLEARGGRVDTYIPQRKNEGYGLNTEALKFIYEQGTTLLVTVDCGISGINEVREAPAGLDIIITDHHTVPAELPEAYAIVNPKQVDCPYPFKDLSGVGIAFKLCQALELGPAGGIPHWEGLTELVALGTVADIVPLLGENRELVRRGLVAMQNTSLIGLQALIDASNLTGQAISSENIGFVLAPRLNAVGRLEHAQLAVELLVSKDMAEAREIAAMLNKENQERQEISSKIQAEAEVMLAQEQHLDTAIVLGSPDWHQGVIGIVASRLVEKYHLPTILMSYNQGMAKGSCRSIPALNLYDAIASQSALLTQFGGHHQAAGLTLSMENVEAFKRGFKEYVKSHLAPEDYYPHQNIDCLIGCQGNITERDLKELELLEPCGAGNNSPVFAMHRALIRGARPMGKTGTHLQFIVAKGEHLYRSFMWNRKELLPKLCDNMVADVAFMPKLNEYRGDVSVQLRSLSIRQKLSVWDLRRNQEDKNHVLKGILRTNSRVLICVNRDDKIKLKFFLQEWFEEAEAIVELVSYNELYSLAEQGKAYTGIIFYSLPQESIRELLVAVKAMTEQLVLLFREGELCQLKTAQLPNREDLVKAYFQVKNGLAAGPQELERFVFNNGAVISCRQLEIFKELGFIYETEGKICLGNIKKCSLEQSPLYALLQNERDKMYNRYVDNLRVSQYEILRG